MKTWATILPLLVLAFADMQAATAQQTDVPALELFWRLPVSNIPADEAKVAAFVKEYRDANRVAIPQFNLATSKDLVIAHSVGQCIAIEFQTGKRIWEFPWQVEEINNPTAASESEDGQELRDRIWNDAVEASFTIDGDQLLLINEIRRSAQTRPLIVIRPDQNLAARRHPSGKLTSLLIPQQGKLRWAAGGVHSEDPKLDDCFLLSSGLPSGKVLYVLGIQEKDLHLLAIDKRAGTLRWKTRIELELAESKDKPDDFPTFAAHVTMVGAHPVVVSDRIIFATGWGKVIAVDQKTHKVAWSVTHPNHSQRVVFDLRSAEDPQEKRWLDHAVFAAGDRVLATPMESQHLLCLDAASGKEHWRSERGDRLFIAIKGDVCMLIGPHDVTAVSIQTGKPLWGDRPAKLPAKSMVTGRGVFDGDRYLLPDDQGNLHAIAWKTGQIDRIAKFEEPLGNLLFHQGRLLSQGPIWIDCFQEFER